MVCCIRALNYTYSYEWKTTVQVRPISSPEALGLTKKYSSDHQKVLVKVLFLPLRIPTWILYQKILRGKYTWRHLRAPHPWKARRVCIYQMWSMVGPVPNKYKPPHHIPQFHCSFSIVALVQVSSASVERVYPSEANLRNYRGHCTRRTWKSVCLNVAILILYTLIK